MWRWLFWLLIIIAIAGVAVFAFQYRDNLFTGNNLPSIFDALQDDAASDRAEYGSTSGTHPEEYPITDDDAAYVITTQSCNTECADFSSDPAGLAYCRNVCGLAQSDFDAAAQCTALDGLEQDYCLREKAVSETSFSLCEQINDSGIRQSCENRITEEIMDQQQRDF